MSLRSGLGCRRVVRPPGFLGVLGRAQCAPWAWKLPASKPHSRRVPAWPVRCRRSPPGFLTCRQEPLPPPPPLGLLSVASPEGRIYCLSPWSFTSDSEDGLWVLGGAAMPVLSPPRTGVQSEAKSEAFFPVSHPWVSWLLGDTSPVTSSFCSCLGGSSGPSNGLEAPRNPVP